MKPPVTIKSDDVVLPLGSSAEPDTCGSCMFFSRANDYATSGYPDMGRCGIKLPPINYVDKGWDGEGFGPRGVEDTWRCDLHRPDGKTYVVQRRITP